MTDEATRETDRRITHGVDMHSARWHLAATAQERLGAGIADGPVDSDRAKLRLDMWRQEAVLAAEESRLDDYLTILGLDAAELAGLLAEPAETVRTRFGQRPDYLGAIEHAYLRVTDGRNGEDQGPQRLPGQSHLTFAEIAAPLVADGARQIETAVRTLLATQPSTHLDPDILIPQLIAPPVEGIAGIVDKTLVLEMNVLRVQGELAGNDPHERFHNFIARLHDPSFALAVFEEYPVLARDLVRLIRNWVRVRIEFAERLSADITELVALLDTGSTTPGTVGSVRFGAGDSHRGGRTVATVAFSSGHRAVYKPRSLAVERHFQELLDWLGERGAEPRLRTIWVLDRADYGWSEFVEAQPCADRAAVARFYRRQGMLLAVLHALSAIDFHWENLIAAGEHPMLVDLEALFHQAHIPPEVPQVPAAAQSTVLESVLAVGLLPRPTVWNEDHEVEGIDMSGLAGGEGQRTPMKVPGWDGRGTDEMHLVRTRQVMPHWSNRPVVDEQTANALEFQEEIVAGYRAMYRLFVIESDALIADDGPIQAFADDEIRILLRATRIYARVLQEGHHPDVLRDALDRQRFYSCLSVQQQWPEHAESLAAAELAQIERGDIPMFTTKPSSVDLYVGDPGDAAGKVITGVLPISGLQRCMERIAAFDEAHLRQQTWFVEGSLTALAMGEAGALKPPADLALVQSQASEEQYRDAAVELAEEVLSTSIVAGDQIAWLGLTLVADRVWTLGPTPNDLFNGIPGISLFLGHLAELTGHSRYAELANTTANSLVHQAELFADVTPELWEQLTVGVFNELGGSIYALSHLSSVLDRADLGDAARQLCGYLPALVDTDRALDVMAGSAGAILALLAAHAVTGDAALLHNAHSFGQHLAEQAVEMPVGRAWQGSLDEGVALAGMSHGASGIALALSRLDTARGERRYRALIVDACDYERSLFDERTGNWPDLRTLTPESSSMMAWCHGAPGIGLARAELLGYLDESGAPTDGVRADLDRAADTMLAATQRGSFSSIGNHSLCHGDLGNVECLLAVTDATGSPALHAATDRVLSTVFADGTANGWACGVPLGVATPGLMTGLSGIGLWLLRRIAPERVPSVLAVQPPQPR